MLPTEKTLYRKDCQPGVRPMTSPRLEGKKRKNHARINQNEHLSERLGALGYG